MQLIKRVIIQGESQHPMNLFTTTLASQVLRHLAAVLTVLAATLVLRILDPYLDVQLIVLLFLLPVLVSTYAWGLTPGVLAGFFAFLAFNYFFLLPLHTFRVHQAQDLITLIMFLVVAVLLSQLIGQARAGLKLAHQHEEEATRMYGLISTLAGLQDRQSIASALAAHTLDSYSFDQVQVTIAARVDEPAFSVALPEGTALALPADSRLPIQTARGQEGEFLLWHAGSLGEEESRLLDAFASQGALALERIRLARSENKTRILEESDRLKSSLLNSVSHELRTPLAAIKASVSSLRSPGVDLGPEARQDLLATIEEETDDLNMLVGNILDMSRIESGALKPQRRWNAMAEIAAGAATRMRTQLQNHTLAVDFPASLPPVQVDYVMIQQVFTNLISNSIKYAPPGTRIALRGRVEGPYFLVTVSNKGPAVPEEHLTRIFDKFYRVTEADRVTGTGLGLSICKGLIEAHGGQIWASNEPDGFTFHFRLPLKPGEAPPDVPAEDSSG